MKIFIIKTINNTKKCLTFGVLTLLFTSNAFAKSIAITNATLHTATQAGVLENATLVIKNGIISDINPAIFDVDEVIDAKGKNVTPGLIGSMNQLGLIEVNAVAASRDASEDKADITFDTSTAFNPKSTLISFARKGGITSNIVVPNGGESMFRGQAFFANLSGEFTSVLATNKAIILDLGQKSKGSRATAIQIFTRKLEDEQDKLRNTKKQSSDKDNNKKTKRDEQAFKDVLTKAKPVIAFAERATDLLVLIQLKERFNLDMVIVGASDAVLVKHELKTANVPVIINAMKNLPSSFDSLNASLNNASILTKAGVKVGLFIEDTHNLYQLRFSVGNAIANGLERDNALATVTANIADIFKLNTGSITKGKQADLVLWSADPFELSTQVEKLWIQGKEVSTESRQDALRNRYLTETDMPKAYIK